MLKRAVGVVLTVLMLGLGTGHALAAGSGDCTGASWGFQCSVQDPGQGAVAAYVGSGSTQHCVDPNGVVLPCLVAGLGYWDGTRGCYLGPVSPQPPFTDPIWNAQTDGTVYMCSWGGGSRAYLVWLAAGPSAAPDPAVLARQAVTQMRLRAVTIGMTPDPTPGSMGLVGLPIWLWSASPDASSWGPVTKTVSAGAYSVTATGKVTQVVWSMGDGGTVACTSPGTSYVDSFGMSPSPDCGYRYVQQGTYTITATSYWTINWSGIGQSGVIHQTYTSSVVVTIGELQTVVVKG